MPNPTENGRNVAVPDENRASWRPEDESSQERDRARPDDRHRNRDDDRYQGGERERSRWSGRAGDGRDDSDRMRGRSGERQVVQTDDRFTGRGDSYWPDREERTGYGSPHGAPGYGRSHEAGYGQSGYGAGYGPMSQRHGERVQTGYGQGYGERMQSGYGQGYGGSHEDNELGRRGPFYRDDEGQHGTIQGRVVRGQNYGTNHGRGWENREAGQHRGKGPKGYVRSDERIRENICEALSEDGEIDATHIEVVVENGDVILTGTVDDRASKRAAEDLVERVAGIKDVQNQLRVQSPQSNQTAGTAVGKRETT